MLRKFAAALAVVLLGVSPAAAHGGSYVYIPVVIPGGPILVPAAKIGDTSHIHNVAVITALGENMTLGRAGWLADHSTVNIADMGLDNFVDGALRKYLTGHFTMVDVPYDRAKLAAIPNGTLDFTTKEVETYLAALPADGVDAFIVVRPDGEAGGANTPGLSLNTGNGGKQSGISANFEIDIVDAKTHQTISHALSRIEPREGSGAHFASMYGPEDLKIEPDQTLTADQRTKLRAQYVKLLSNALIETLRALDLGVALPKPGERVMIPTPEEKRPKAKTIAFVSVVGGELTLDHRGMFFAHDTATMPIADWNIDAEIEAKMAAVLDKRLTLKPANADRAKIIKQYVELTKSNVSAPVEGLPEAGDVDVYIVVIKAPGVGGAGLVMYHLTPAGENTTDVILNCIFMAVDGKTHKPIFARYMEVSPAMPWPKPITQVDNSDWPEKPPLSAAQAGAVHKTISDLLDDSIPETMMRLGLTGMMPSGELPPAPSQAPAQ